VIFLIQSFFIPRGLLYLNYELIIHKIGGGITYNKRCELSTTLNYIKGLSSQTSLFILIQIDWKFLQRNSQLGKIEIPLL